MKYLFKVTYVSSVLEYIVFNKIVIDFVKNKMCSIYLEAKIK